MNSNLPLEWENKENNAELLAFLQQYGSKEYLTADEINNVRDGINEIFYKVTGAKIYENGELQIFRKAGTTPDPSNINPNIGDWCIGVIQDQFINAEFLGGDKNLLTSYNI